MRLWILVLLVSALTCVRPIGSLAQQSASLSIQESDWPAATWGLAPQIVSYPQQCAVHLCGLPTPSFCAVTCAPNQIAACSCDCTSRVLGVCAELKSSCTCEKPPENRWWTFW